MQHGTMQHHLIVAGKHLKQARCSSRQKVQAGTLCKQEKSPNKQKVQARTFYHATCNIKPRNMQHATWYHALSSHHSRQTSQAGKMFKKAKVQAGKLQASTS